MLLKEINGFKLTGFNNNNQTKENFKKAKKASIVYTQSLGDYGNIEHIQVFKVIMKSDFLNKFL